MKTEIRDQRSEIRSSGSDEFEETLRLIARLSAPEGLEERVQVGLRAASRTTSGRARLLQWPVALRLNNAWMQSSLARMAAAAAIAAVVIGGGWVVSSRVQPAQPARAIAIPPRVSVQGSFSSAGAMRTPQTLNGPVVAQPAKSDAKPAAKTPIHRGKPASKANSQTIAPAAK